MDGKTAHLIDVALDLKLAIDDLDAIRREHGDDPKIGRTMLKLREAYADLISLAPAPHSLPPHQSA